MGLAFAKSDILNLDFRGHAVECTRPTARESLAWDRLLAKLGEGAVQDADFDAVLAALGKHVRAVDGELVTPDLLEKSLSSQDVGMLFLALYQAIQLTEAEKKESPTP